MLRTVLVIMKWSVAALIAIALWAVVIVAVTGMIKAVR